MFESLGRFVVRRRKSVLILFVIGVLAAGGVGSLAFGKLDTGGYSDLGSESAKAATYLTDKFKVQEPIAVLVVDSGNLEVSDPTVMSAAKALEERVSKVSGVTRTISYWSTGGVPSLKSNDSKAAFLFVYADIKAGDFDTFGSIGADIQKKFDGKQGLLTVYASGGGVITHSINEKIGKDLKLAETIAIPLTFVLLAFVFGALVASAMPLVIGISAILGSFLLIFIFSLFTNVSVFALNLITGLGMGLGIDYALLMVNRFREELHHGKSIEDSVIETVATAGRTVFYSGLTVLVTLASLLLFPLNFLKSFGMAGVSVVAIAVLGALIPLPALLAIIGEKVDKGVVRKNGITPKEDGRWAHTARNVMKRPVIVSLGSLALLAILAAPVTNIAFAQIDSRVLPESHPAAIAGKVITDRFTSFEGSPIEVVFPNGVGKETQLQTYLNKVKGVEGVSRIENPEVYGSDIRVQIIPSISSRTTDAEVLIRAIRAIDKPEGILIGGTAAD
ncbi:MAG: MMPL family transporter, partial [Actinobacteria bacterium]|nr:MMPL family transporter [Actinomycetota bacterium]